VNDDFAALLGSNGHVRISRGLAVTPLGRQVVDIAIRNGTIAHLSTPDRVPLAAGSAQLDALGLYVLHGGTVLVAPGATCSLAGVTCRLQAAGTQPAAGNWLPVWYPEPADLRSSLLAETVAENIWGRGMPVVGIVAERGAGGGFATGDLNDLAAACAATGALLVVWLSSEADVARVGAELADASARVNGRLLLATRGVAATTAAASLLAAGRGRHSLAVAASLATLLARDAELLWDYVRRGTIAALSVWGDEPGAEATVGEDGICLLHQIGVVAGRVSLERFSAIVSFDLAALAGISTTPFVPGASADLMVFDPEAERDFAYGGGIHARGDLRTTLLGGVPIAAARGMALRGRPKPWPQE
jgi:hypothetical protein